MKALEILNKYRKEQEWLLNSIKQSLPHRDIRIINDDIQTCDEAISELEALENRSCESCKYYNNCAVYSLIEDDFNDDFYCNGWESK